MTPFPLPLFRRLKDVIVRLRYALSCAALLLVALPASATRIFTIAGNGSATSSGDGSTAIAAGLIQPVDMGQDGNGNLYVLDAGARAVRRIGFDNTIRTVVSVPAGARALAVARDATLYVSLPGELRRIGPTGAVTSYPLTVEGLDVDASGNLFMADPDHHVVRRLSATGELTVVAGNGFAGRCGDRDSATGPCLGDPRDVAVGADGLYIADPGNQMVWRVDAQGVLWFGVTVPQLTLAPKRIALNTSTDILPAIYYTNVGDPAQVFLIHPQGNGERITGTGVAGYSIDGGGAIVAQVNNVGGLFVAPNHALFLADTDNHRVRRIPEDHARSTGYDFDWNGAQELVWRNRYTGVNVVWPGAEPAQSHPLTRVTNVDWEIVGGGEFSPDWFGTDILWRNRRTGANAIWISGNAAQLQPIPSVTNVAWQVAGIGEFDNDATARDILWRNVQTGANVVWRAAKANLPQTVATAGPQWQVAGLGDFDADGLSDIFWRDPSTGANVFWRMGKATLSQVLPTVPAPWQVAGVGDFDGDGRSDILWRNTATGANVIWRTGDARMQMAVPSMSTAWSVAAVSDYDASSSDDVLWRNTGTGANLLWVSPLMTARSLPTVSPDWVPAR